MERKFIIHMTKEKKFEWFEHVMLMGHEKLPKLAFVKEPEGR